MRLQWWLHPPLPGAARPEAFVVSSDSPPATGHSPRSAPAALHASILLLEFRYVRPTEPLKNPQVAVHRQKLPRILPQLGPGTAVYGTFAPKMHIFHLNAAGTAPKPARALRLPCW